MKETKLERQKRMALETIERQCKILAKIYGLPIDEIAYNSRTGLKMEYTEDDYLIENFPIKTILKIKSYEVAMERQIAKARIIGLIISDEIDWI